MTLVLGAGQSLEPELRLPLLADHVRRPQRIGPIDRRPAAEAEAGLDRHVQVRSGARAAAPVRVLIRGNLQLQEIAVVEVAAGLEHDDLQTPGRENAGHDPSAGTRADDADVGFERHVGLGDERLQRLLVFRRGADRARVPERRPVRVLAALIRQSVIEKQRQALERADAGSDLRTHQGHVAQNLLA